MHAIHVRKWSPELTETTFAWELARRMSNISYREAQIVHSEVRYGINEYLVPFTYWQPHNYLLPWWPLLPAN